MFGRPSASFTYSTKSGVFGSRCSCVLRSRMRRAELAGTKCTRSPSSVAKGSPSRSWSATDFGASAIAFSTTFRGKVTRPVTGSAAIPTAARRFRACSSSMCTPVFSRTPSASSTMRAGSDGSRTCRRGLMGSLEATSLAPRMRGKEKARGSTPRAPYSGSAEQLDLGDVGGAGPLGAVHHLEPHPIAIGESPEAVGADLGVVDENVRTTLARQEAETLGLIEPLDGTFDHERAGLLGPLPAATSPARPTKQKPPTAGGSVKTTPSQRQPAAG